jgi:hypothetical protein
LPTLTGKCEIRGITPEIFWNLENSRCQVKNEPKQKFLKTGKIILEQAFADFLANNFGLESASPCGNPKTRQTTAKNFPRLPNPYCPSKK